jgi:N-acyl-phosphatidylethanolamine-hydrolysing phospholipase D
MNGKIHGSLLLLLLVGAAVTAICYAQAKPGPAEDLPEHHTPNGFRNLHIEDKGRFLDFLRWRLGLGPEEESALPPEEVPPYNPRVHIPDLNRLRHPNPREIQVTWIGHSTFLLQVAGLNILTDPIFSDRASPLSFIGPRRRVPPGMLLEELPPVHAVIISHNHYDHLDAPTVTRLGGDVRFYVPLGLAEWFQRRGLNRVEELDWWQSASLEGIRLHAVPAQHFSMRSLFDRNRTLWCGWVLETPAGKIYFSGDTGYSPHFQEIGQRLGPMRLSLIHVGGYLPRWFMRSMHANPEEAVRIHRDVRSQQSIGMHWGVFKLTDEPLSEPPLLLERARQEAKIPPENFVVFDIGETRTFSGKQ